MSKNNETPRTVADIYSGEQMQDPMNRAHDIRNYFLGRGLVDLAMGVEHTNEAHKDGVFTDEQAHAALSFYETMQVGDAAMLAEHQAILATTPSVEQTVPDATEQVVAALPDLAFAG